MGAKMTDNMEMKIRHLEMIQRVITRMSSNSLLLKGWAITLMAGIFAITEERNNCCLLVYLLIILFWLLDSMYLQFERQFKVLYKNIAEGKQSEAAFKIYRPAPQWEEHTKYIQALYSRTEILFYVALLMSNAIWQLLVE